MRAEVKTVDFVGLLFEERSLSERRNGTRLGGIAVEYSLRLFVASSIRSNDFLHNDHLSRCTKCDLDLAGSP